MIWYANQFLHFCRLRDQTNTKVALFLTGGKVGCTSFCTLELTNNTKLANHGKEFVSFSTSRCHLVHYPARSSNNTILNLHNCPSTNSARSLEHRWSDECNKVWQSTVPFDRVKQCLLEQCLNLQARITRDLMPFCMSQCKLKHEELENIKRNLQN